MLSGIDIRNIYHIFPLLCRKFDKLRGTAEGVGDVDDNIVRLFNHPFISPGNSKAWVYLLDALWYYCMKFIQSIEALLSAGHVCQNNMVFNMWVLLCQFRQHMANLIIKGTLITNIKQLDLMFFNQLNQNRL